MRPVFFAVLIGLSFATTNSAQAQSTDGHVMKHSEHANMGEMTKPVLPVEGGQSGFAAIAEIVALLNQDPNTDWSKVNINALREHLVDMSELTLKANVETLIEIDKVVFAVTGNGGAKRAIQAMVPAHSAVLTAGNLYQVEAETTENGAVMRVAYADDHALQQIKALGFFGIMATGAHHQEHHLQMATGAGHPH